MKTKLLLAAAVFVSLPVHADFMGALDGRSADLESQAQMSVELHANTFSKDMAWAGARFSYKLSDTLMVFGDASQMDATDNDDPDFEMAFKGQAFGGGLILSVPGMVPSINTALRLSYHAADLPNEKETTISNQTVESEIGLTAMSAKLLLSPSEPLNETGMTWYASVGYFKADANISASSAIRSVSIDSELAAGGAVGVGLIVPLSFGDAYVGYEYLDGESVSGGGLRFSF